MNRICTVFPGGSYGTFLDWCLNYFSTSDFDPNMPFRSTGSSHDFDGNHITIADLATQGLNHEMPTARLHPKTDEDDDIIQALTSVQPYFEKIIYLYPTEASMAWTINNKFEKVWEEGWLKHNESLFLDNLRAWNRNSILDMSPWEQREFLSMYIYQQHLVENEILNLDQIRSRFSDFLFVDVADLRDNFEQTLKQIFAYWDRPMQNTDQIHTVYSNWIELQRHCNKDQIINDIVHSIVHRRTMDWSTKNLTTVDEALIQMQLRLHGLEIRCFDLDQFPQSTIELEPYLYVA